MRRRASIGQAAQRNDSASLARNDPASPSRKEIGTLRRASIGRAPRVKKSARFGAHRSGKPRNDSASPGAQQIGNPCAQRFGMPVSMRSGESDGGTVRRAGRPEHSASDVTSTHGHVGRSADSAVLVVLFGGYRCACSPCLGVIRRRV
jgi:hypothetical protein